MFRSLKESCAAPAPSLPYPLTRTRLNTQNSLETFIGVSNSSFDSTSVLDRLPGPRKGPGATCELSHALHWTSNLTSPGPLASTRGPGEVGIEVQRNVSDSSHVAPGPIRAPGRQSRQDVESKIEFETPYVILDPRISLQYVFFFRVPRTDNEPMPQLGGPWRAPVGGPGASLGAQGPPRGRAWNARAGV